MGVMRGPRPMEAEQSTGTKEALQKEWLVATLQPNGQYSVSDRVQSPAADGGAEELPRTQYFHLLSVAHGSSRPHDVPTHESADNALHTARIAVQVQLYSALLAAEEREDS